MTKDESTTTPGVNSRWQFWIDVGGTFTDCIARCPDGELRRYKGLSSGITKGSVGEGSNTVTICDAARHEDPEQFWQGSTIRLIDASGQPGESTRVAEFDRGRLQLESPLGRLPLAGTNYELCPGEEAPTLAIRYLLGLPPGHPLPPVTVRLGTTRGTNALLTRQGARTALVTTVGFRDVLAIGYQNRPHLFDLDIHKPPPLCEAVLEIDERVTAEGTVLRAPDPARVLAELTALRHQGIESLAICLLHGDRYPLHELQVEQLARAAGFVEVSVSSQVAPLMKIVARGDTTALDAYLNPVLRSYLGKLQSTFAVDAGSEFRLLTSAGGLVSSQDFHGKDSILSGPAGGVVGYSRIAQAAGFERSIGFDMGGTSTDVSRFDGRFDLEYETQKAGVRVVAPMMAIETVAAGGGSICWFDGVKLAVGPRSAGADPGPACYGRGGPLAVTDINLFLGKLLPDHFPFQLDRRAVEARLRELADQVASETQRRLPPVELADGFLHVANITMARAIRSISIAKGYDPETYVLVAFGGAAPQHACALAEQLRIPRVLIHRDASLLSAYGVGTADLIRHAWTGVYRDYATLSAADVEAQFHALAEQPRRELLAEGVAREEIELNLLLLLRYQGTDAALPILRPADGDFATAFAAEHERMYGYTLNARPLEVVAAQVEAIGRSTIRPPVSQRCDDPRRIVAARSTEIFFAARRQTAAVHHRADLPPGALIPGPALVLDETTTTVIDPGWRAELLTGGELLLEPSRDTPGQRIRPAAARGASGATSDAADPATLEVFNNHFAGIAEQMGITLRQTACSVNVKERLDFSCALFTAQGDLVVNAPHIPVHLGAMGETVKRVIADNPDISPGDVVVTNDPYRGGSHLPDITVVTPVHDHASGQLRFFTASRAHHAEIGGIAPGSMSPFSKNLSEEGVLIRNFKLLDAGQPRFEQLRNLLLAGPFPTRDADMNLADIAAQIAANRQGAGDLQQLIGRYGWPLVEAYMGHIQQAAEQQVRRALRQRPDGRYQFLDRLDDGSPIAVAITIADGEAEFDFTGTGPVLSSNLNANRAIVTAAIMYCLRCLLDEPIPLNQGVLAPVRLVLPECLLNPPEREQARDCAAVAGGNVETSQRVVDVILGALGVAAASQGTMNNVLFGNRTFGYYETVCGGAGATPTADGADAIHTHMTNTRLTDPEVLESRFPVLVREFSIRPGSGGAGRHRGGNGVVRRLEFRTDLELSLLCQRRGPYPPYGLAGGEPGTLGMNELERADGRLEPLGGSAQLSVQAGDTLVLKTPGGGGFGRP